jgi:hypothetical protein
VSWAIERDESGQPVRMWWMGVPKREPKVIPKTGCDECGYHFGWHKFGCSKKGDGAKHD